MKKNFLIPFALLGVLASCANEEEKETVRNLEDQEGTYFSVSSLKSSNHTISIEDAQKNAEDAISMFSSSNGLKNARSKKVSNVVVIKTPNSKLKSANAYMPDTLAYVVNFADSAGFALVSADDRVACPVLAFIDNGNFSSESDNENLNLMMDMSQEYIQNTIVEFENNKEACLAYLNSNGEPEQTNHGLKAVTLVGPYVNTTWGQDSPYNLYIRCANDNSKAGKAGCMPIAVGQMMTYYKYASKSYPWSTIVNTPKNSVEVMSRMLSIANLVAWIGNTLGTKYGESESSTSLEWTSTGSKPFTSSKIQELGYENARYNYSWTSLKTQLDQRPVVMMGDRVKSDGSLSGHAWIADGYRRIQITQTVVYSTPVGNKTANVKVDQYYVHNNWGWNGKNNGYFAKDCFNVAKGSFDKSTGNDQTYNYTKNLKFFIMTPKK